MLRIVRPAVALVVATAIAVVYPKVAAVHDPVAAAPTVPPVVDGVTDIMPLGDSITGSTGCWRELLWNRLREAGYDRIDFVGHRAGPECSGSGYDSDSNGFSGTRVSELAASGELSEWLQEDYADIVLMHYGSNDIRHGKTLDEILTGLSIIVEQLRRSNPNVVVLVARIIPMTTEPMDKSCPDCPDKVTELNAAIPGWAADHDSIRSPVKVVDQAAGFDPRTDTYDGLHSDDSGGRKIADAWFTALTQVL